MAKQDISNDGLTLVLPKWVYDIVWNQLTLKHRKGDCRDGFEQLFVNGCRLSYSENESEVGLCVPRQVYKWRKINLGNTGSV